MPESVEKLEIQHYVSLKEATTLAIGGTCRMFALVRHPNQVPELLDIIARTKIPVWVLGGGSNCVCTDGEIDVLVVHVAYTDRRMWQDTSLQKNQHMLEIGAGEVWDNVCAYTVEHGLQGVEALSGIPGSVGGALVQNIGAYGSEIRDVFVSAQVLDLLTGEINTVDHTWCDFTYRNTRLKRASAGQYVVLSVTLCLQKTNQPPIPDYKGVATYIEEHVQGDVTLADVRQAILEIRKGKLPDWQTIPNAGSFFKNPIIKQEKADEILQLFPDMPTYSTDKEGCVKLSAGWMLDQLGYKGRWFGGLQVYPKHALVITNPDKKGTFADLQEFIHTATGEIYEKFQVRLEPEPILMQNEK